jgi:beta-1,4-mannosyltransferase
MAFVVLQSFPDPRPTTNPYVVMLARSLAAVPGVEVRTFSWRTALTGDYDVFHAHWPETLVSGRTRPRQFVRQALFALLLLRLALRGTPLVRTVHNLELPRDISRSQTLLLKLAERRTTAFVVLNESTPAPAEKPSELIPLGHYREWFAQHPRSSAVAGRLNFFGMVRRYKSVDDLIRAFRQTQAVDLSLRITGSPSTPELAATLIALADGDDRISFALDFLTDERLVAEVTAAELVILPYAAMHNSASVLASLSLARPVLVPDNEVNRRLRDEVGGNWVQCYEPPLTGAAIVHALALVQRDRPDEPDLRRRDWDRAGEDHLRIYRLAAERARRRRRWPRPRSQSIAPDGGSLVVSSSDNPQTPEDSAR